MSDFFKRIETLQIISLYHESKKLSLGDRGGECIIEGKSLLFKIMGPIFIMLGTYDRFPS